MSRAWRREGVATRAGREVREQVLALFRYDRWVAHGHLRNLNARRLLDREASRRPSGRHDFPCSHAVVIISFTLSSIGRAEDPAAREHRDDARDLATLSMWASREAAVIDGASSVPGADSHGSGYPFQCRAINAERSPGRTRGRRGRASPLKRRRPESMQQEYEIPCHESHEFQRIGCPAPAPHLAPPRRPPPPPRPRAPPRCAPRALLG